MDSIRFLLLHFSYDLCDLQDVKELCKIDGTKWDNVYYFPSPSLLLTPAAFLLLFLPYLIPSLTPCLEFYFCHQQYL